MRRLSVVFLLAAAVPAAQPRPSDQNVRQSEQFFRNNDADADGKLTIEEFPERNRGAFARIDADNDGFVTSQEDVAYRAARRSGWRRPALPEGVRVLRDIVYAKAPEQELKLDLYLPEKRPEKPLPLIVWIHGGAWRAGSKEGNPAAPFAAAGYVSASISYRLSQTAVFPAQIHDCKAAVRWLRAHAGEYGIDPERVAVWGSSAGGHLVALMGTSGGAAELEGGLGYPRQSSRVQAVVDFFGPTTFTKMDAAGSRMVHDAPDSPESMLIGGAIQEHPELVRRVDPITYVSADDPPFLIVHGDKDLTVPYNQSELLAEALAAAGVEHTFHTVKGGGHGNGGEFGSPKLRAMVKRFLDEKLGAAQ